MPAQTATWPYQHMKQLSAYSRPEGSLAPHISGDGPYTGWMDRALIFSEAALTALGRRIHTFFLLLSSPRLLGRLWCHVDLRSTDCGTIRAVESGRSSVWLNTSCEQLAPHHPDSVGDISFCDRKSVKGRLRLWCLGLQYTPIGQL